MDLIRPTLDMALACEPDRIVVAYSPEYMADGINAASHLRRFIENRVGIPVTLASDSVPEALKALVQVGTALVCAGFIDSLEAHHGKPVVAVNSATYWLALREHGIGDRVDGHGLLFKKC